MKALSFLIISSLICATCSKQVIVDEENKNYQDFTTLKKGKVIRLRCYFTNIRKLRNEVELKKFRCGGVNGNMAQIIWTQLLNRSEYIRVTPGLRKTNQDYQVVAEDEDGRKASIIIVSTYARSNTRFVGCSDGRGRSWMVELGEDQVLLLGIK